MKECLYLHQQQQQQQQQRSPSADSANENNTVGNNSMPCWYYDKKELRDTPSILDGISFETERRYRKEGARFIMTCGTQMGLGHNTMATGVVYFHRFYMFQSFKSFPRYVTACCCLFLAGKVEETPKKCRDIIKTARALLADHHFYSFGEDPKEEVMTLERILLQTIKFDLQVEHPYSFLLKYAKCFKGDQQKLQKMVQMAWNFVNDSLSTVVCLQWEPEIIAVALIHLASKLSKFTVIDWVGRQSNHLRWWDMFVADVTMEILEDICHQVLDLYQSNQKESTGSQSPPQNPPSRAESPPLARYIPSASSTTSPVGKTKPVVTGATTCTVTLATASATSNNSHSTELSNIQTIKSLANTTPAAPLPAESTMPTAPHVSAYHMYAQPPPVSAHPHQMHAIYGAATSAAPPPPPPHGYGLPGPPVQTPANVVPVPLPPPPPMAPYGAPPTNNWQPPMQTSHYTTAPPPMPPGPPHQPHQSHQSQPHSSNRMPTPRSGGGHGGYYHQHQTASYGRQQRY